MKGSCIELKFKASKLCEIGLIDWGKFHYMLTVIKFTAADLQEAFVDRLISAISFASPVPRFLCSGDLRTYGVIDGIAALTGGSFMPQIDLESLPLSP